MYQITAGEGTIAVFFLLLFIALFWCTYVGYQFGRGYGSAAN